MSIVIHIEIERLGAKRTLVQSLKEKVVLKGRGLSCCLDENKE